MTARAAERAVLRLAAFVPFRLNRLAGAVSEHLAGIYRGRFGLEIPEWRVMATLGQERVCTAQFVAASTRMHKTRVSRAIAALRERALLEDADAGVDRREKQLRLTAAGRRLYAQLVPLALAREEELLACLPPDARRAFLAALERLEAQLGL
ncbi:MAG TPA: MarR family winged helix-turn-helix transcriptional regulator [Steroidobacteraceae bacterium]|nr:MarR family winged helix-turn-helix transcriptional regulator [Steroidobacteraceae bacterium]